MDGRLEVLAGTSALRLWAAASDAVALRFGAPGDDAEPA
jgi:hypothetical protein